MILIFSSYTEDLFQLLCTKRERIHGGISVSEYTSRGFDVLKEGIFDDRNRKTKNRNG